MVARQFRVVWTKQAEKHLREAYEHIAEDSPQNALKVINDITKGMEKAITNLRVRHTKMPPKYY